MNQELKELLLQLTREQQILFAALTCEKMYPLYQRFHILSNWGNEDVYAEGIVNLYNSLITNDISDYELFIDSLEYITPDLDDFTGNAAAYAADACIALIEATTFLLDFNVEHIINCSTSATDTVDMYIQLVEDLDVNLATLNEVVDSHVVMRTEIQRQKQLLSALSRVNDFTNQEIVTLRNLNGAVAIIDLSTLRL